MNQSIFIFLFSLTIVLNALNAQQSINIAMDYNARFDEIIKQDEAIKIISSPPNTKSKLHIPKSALAYNKNKDYSGQFVLYDFCKRNYKEKDVIKFIEDVFADTTREDFFARDLHLLPCKAVMNYESVRNIFIDYYKRNIKLNPEDTEWEQKFFNFQVVNNLPNTLDLINTYFENIGSGKRKLRNGQSLIIRLIEIGEEKRALDLLEFYSQKILTGEIEHNLYLDESISGKNGGLLLALSDNDEISKKATHILFQYYENTKYGIGFDEQQLLEYANKKRYVEFEKKRFYKSKIADLSNKYNLERYVSNISEILRLSGKEMGKEIWGYIKNDQNLLNGRYFKQSLHYCLEKILEDPKLTEIDKKDIINYFKDHNKYINGQTDETSHQTLIQYLYLIRTCYPEISDEEIEIHIPQKYLDTSWEYAWRDAKNYKLLYGEIPSDLNAVKNCHSDLQNSVILGNDYPEDLNKYWTFMIHSSGGLNIPNYLMITFNNSEKVLGFDTEGGYAPLDYVDLFAREFYPILQAEGIHNIYVAQKVTGDNRNFNYNIQIVTPNGTQEFQYYSGSDWYEPDLFVKALNLSLIKLDTKLRFFKIETGDQGSSFGLFEPNKIVPFAKKYDMQIGALRSQDIFNDL